MTTSPYIYKLNCFPSYVNRVIYFVMVFSSVNVIVYESNYVYKQFISVLCVTTVFLSLMYTINIILYNYQRNHINICKAYLLAAFGASYE